MERLLDLIYLCLGLLGLATLALWGANHCNANTEATTSFADSTYCGTANVPALPGDWLDESVRAFCTAQGQAHRIGTAEKYQAEGM